MDATYDFGGDEREDDGAETSFEPIASSPFDMDCEEVERHDGKGAERNCAELNVSPLQGSQHPWTMKEAAVGCVCDTVVI